MKPTIEILPGDLDPQKTNLICELSETGFTFLLQDDEAKVISGLSSYPFEADITSGDIPGLLKNIIADSPVLRNSFNKVFFSYSTPEAVLMPVAIRKMTAEEDIISLMHGEQPASTVFIDQVAEKNIFNHYRIATDIHQFIIKNYPLTGFAHQYSLILKTLPVEGKILQVIFYRDKIIAILSLDGTLQIIQTFGYTSPQDIIYNLLNICKQFEADDVHLRISGMIDPESGLFKEIRKCFRHLEFDGYESNVQLNGGDFPSHYFAHLFTMAGCVS